MTLNDISPLRYLTEAYWGYISFVVVSYWCYNNTHSAPTESYLQRETVSVQHYILVLTGVKLLCSSVSFESATYIKKSFTAEVSYIWILIGKCTLRCNLARCVWTKRSFPSSCVSGQKGLVPVLVFLVLVSSTNVSIFRFQK